MGVLAFDSIVARNFVTEDETTLVLTDSGRSFVTQFGIDVNALENSRRPACKSCLDWSARRSHLAGGLGTLLLQHFYELGWAKRENGTRIVNFTRNGEAEFKALFPV